MTPHPAADPARARREPIARRIRQLPRPVKRLVVVSLDAALCAAAFALALMVRLDRVDVFQAIYLPGLVGALLLFLPIFVAAGLYREVFRFSGWTALAQVVKATAVYGVVYAAVFTLLRVGGVPRTVGIIQPVLFLTFVLTSRAVARYWLGGLHRDLKLRDKWPRVLIYGAGNAGQQLASALAHGRKVWLVGFVDDDARLHGSNLQGVPVLPPADLPQLLRKTRVDALLLALPSATRKRRAEIVQAVRAVAPALAVRTLPTVTDIAQGRVQVSQLRDVEVSDLLGRDPIPPDPALLGRNITGKAVLVTGAGGSIGSELCRQILMARPRTLVLVEHSEAALHEVSLDLAQRCTQAGLPTELVPLLASVRDADRLHTVMAAWRPDTVYHAAAYKHVPIVERNPAEGLENNLFGTLQTARAAIAHGVADFVLVSTDKAVRPTNIMGASKRLAEMTLQALSHEPAGAGGTRLSMVRFGNVLDSSGSVVPLFREQIRRGEPVTLTHPDITRYFMTIPEAAQLVIQAGAMARGGDVFVLDMGQPIRIADLARRMIELSGLSVQDELRPDGDVPIRVVGLRPGEKLYEELLIGNDPQPTAHERIMKAHEDFVPWPVLEPQLAALRAAAHANDVVAVRALLQRLVSGYQPSDDVVDWVHRQTTARPAAGGAQPVT
ncbi:nucleoside-diphosphate sugar epimerase/dehydratase [Acidovorax sp. FG27]|uniref:polysaccharide biosynthesis protein n=1 Tax=Acidovorax sp. FG27 TaxID=3133652 RepID=UPI0030E86200